MKVKDLVRQILFNLGIVILAIVLYSPGLIGLTPFDESILRAGFSIICVPVLLFLFYLANHTLFRKQSAVVFKNHTYIVDSETGDNLIKFKQLADELRDMDTWRLVNECIGILLRLFTRVCDDRSLNQTERELRLGALKAKVGFYMDALGETLLCIINLERFGTADSEQDARNYEELLETLTTLRDIFRWILDEESGSSGSKIASEQDLVRAKAELDGYMDNVVRNLADQYNSKY